METEVSHFLVKENAGSIDGKQAQFMKSEPLKRREQFRQAPRLKSKPTMEYNVIEKREKKQVGIVKPLLTMEKDHQQWNCSELEKLQRRFSELIDGKSNDNDKCLLTPQLLTERLQSLYLSMGSDVYVSPCLVNLFHLTDLQVCSLEQWKLLHRGYPIWLYNTGLNPRRSPELRLIIVDEKSGFILWSDRITSLSNLIQPTNLTLSFRHSLNNASVMIRFEQQTDDDFFTKFYSFFKQNQFYKENSLGKHFSKRLIKKSDISPPCHFKHFNHLEENLKDVRRSY